MTPYKDTEFLCETDWLADNLSNPDLRIYDCAAKPALHPDKSLRKKYPLSPQNCRPGYEKKHIPGAGYIDVPGDLTDKTCETPMMLASTPQVVKTFAQAGINNNSYVVLYSSEDPMWATRVWWVLKAVGFDNAAILNGGLAKWMAEGRDISDKPSSYPQGQFKAAMRHGIFVDKEHVLSSLDDDEIVLIHAMMPSVYNGSHETLIFGRRGRIPGSVNIPSGKLHDPKSGTYLQPTALRHLFETIKSENAKNIITYCGGGMNASNVAFALALLGYENVSIYDGSMCEWGNDPSLPIEV